MSKEAMKLALEACKGVWNGGLPFHHVERMGKAIKALEEALAKQEQGEPLFWYRPVGEDGLYEGPIHNASIERVRKECGAWKPLYTTPQQRKPLTDEQIEAIARENDVWLLFRSLAIFDFVRSIESAHGIKGKHDDRHTIAADAAWPDLRQRCADPCGDGWVGGLVFEG